MMETKEESPSASVHSTKSEREREKEKEKDGGGYTTEGPAPSRRDSRAASELSSLLSVGDADTNDQQQPMGDCGCVEGGWGHEVAWRRQEQMHHHTHKMLHAQNLQSAALTEKLDLLFQTLQQTRDVASVSKSLDYPSSPAGSVMSTPAAHVRTPLPLADLDPATLASLSLSGLPNSTATAGGVGGVGAPAPAAPIGGLGTLGTLRSPSLPSAGSIGLTSGGYSFAKRTPSVQGSLADALDHANQTIRLLAEQCRELKLRLTQVESKSCRVEERARASEEAAIAERQRLGKALQDLHNSTQRVADLTDKVTELEENLEESSEKQQETLQRCQALELELVRAQKAKEASEAQRKEWEERCKSSEKRCTDLEQQLAQVQADYSTATKAMAASTQDSTNTLREELASIVRILKENSQLQQTSFAAVSSEIQQHSAQIQTLLASSSSSSSSSSFSSSTDTTNENKNVGTDPTTIVFTETSSSSSKASLKKNRQVGAEAPVSLKTSAEAPEKQIMEASSSSNLQDPSKKSPTLIKSYVTHPSVIGGMGVYLGWRSSLARRWWCCP